MTTEMTTTPARGLALATFDDAWRFWQMVAKTDFAPKDFKGKPEACLLAGQHGAEVGLTPMQSLQSIAIINGRPTIWGDSALALVQSSAACEYIREYLEGEGDALVAVCEAKRRGYPAPTVVRFSVADAKKAGLWGKAGPWQQYPTRMLALRARGFALRNAFADALRGLVTAEEAQDYPTPEPLTKNVKEPQPDEERADPFEVAQKAIAIEKDLQRLKAMRDKVELRMRDKTFTPGQADDLFDSIQARAEFLELESEVQP